MVNCQAVGRAESSFEGRMKASYDRDHEQVSRATSKIKGPDRARKAIEVRPYLFHRERRHGSCDGCDCN